MLTTKQAAERLQVSEASLRVWLNNEEEKAKRFPNAVKFGRDWQIPDTDLLGLPVGRGRGRPPLKAEAKRAEKKPARKRAAK
ncbi:MAG TPA: helix-turn-helix domain-containing protein [Blastocatellia bacterium]|nr:helix-turn-helix domain-containing protein [Blastocatellia bacterium]